MGQRGRWLATYGGDHTAHLWDLDGENPFSSPTVFPHDFVRTMAISPDGRWLVTGGGTFPKELQPKVYSDVRLWDLSAADPTESPIELKGHQQAVLGLKMSQDSRWLATVGHNGEARLWDLSADSPTFQEF